MMNETGTVREAIKEYWHRRSIQLGISYEESAMKHNTCVIIPLGNGHEIFIDNYVALGEVPNKNLVFRKLSFEIEYNKLDLFPPNIRSLPAPESTNEYKYGKDKFISLYFEDVKERDINSFIIDNGGIDDYNYDKKLKELFGCS